MNFDYYKEEQILIKKLFNLEETLQFQSVHDLQIIRGEDWMYECWIDKECYTSALTTLGALVIGIKTFKENVHKL